MLTPIEAAEYKGVHVQSVYRAMSKGRLSYEVRYGVKVASRESLDSWKPKGPGPRKKARQAAEESA